MDAIGVRPGMTVGEIGAGDGYFTFRLARRVGPAGRILANDINAAALRIIENRSRTEGVTNVRTILGAVDDPLFPNTTLDMAFMSFVFHMLEAPVPLLEHLRPSLRPGATLVIVDVKPGDIRMGPYPDNEHVAALAARAGFALVRTETFLERADIYVFTVRGRTPGS